VGASRTVRRIHSCRNGAALGARWPLISGSILMAVGLASAGVWHTHGWQVALELILIGFGFPLASAGTATMLIQAVDPGASGVAMGMNSVIRQIGSTTGAQLAAAVLVGATIAGTSVPTEGAFRDALLMCAAAALAGAGLALLGRPVRASSIDGC